MHLSQECTEIYGDLHSIVSVCPSTTRWTAHKRACLTLCKGYKTILQALRTSFNESKEGEALGLFGQATSSEAIAKLLMLLDAFAAIHSLVLFLESSLANICLCNFPTYVRKAIIDLNNLKDSHRKYFTKESFNYMVTIAEELTSSLPTTSRLRRKTTARNFEKNDEVFGNCVYRFKREIDETFNKALTKPVDF